MTFALGTATGRIELEYDGKGIEAAKKDQQKLMGMSQSSTQGLKTLSNTAGVAGLAIAAGLGVAVNKAADFEQRMSAIGAVSGASGKEMDGLRNKALQLGKDTQFSASESASAIEELVKAGLSVSDVLNGAADATVNLAAAGEVSMPEAAAISSNAMNQFGLTAKDMVGVVDQIAGAANASAIDVGEFGQSLAQVGAVAHLAGVSFDDTATAIAIMGNAGIKGSDAGTSLKSMFQRLQPQTKKQADQMRELGILTLNNKKAFQDLTSLGLKPASQSTKDITSAAQAYFAAQGQGAAGTTQNNKAVEKYLSLADLQNNAFYDAKGNTKSLAQVSEVLKTSLKGMTQQQKQAALQTLFGSDAIRGAAILSEQGAKGFDKMSKSMGKVSAADVAKKRMDNFRGSLEQMKGSLETAGIAIGTALLPFLRQLVDFITKLANWFLGLSDTQQKWILSIIAAVGALLLIGAGIAKLIIFINSINVALTALKGTFIATWLAAAGPVILVIAIIAALVVAIIILWKKSETFRDIVKGVWSAIKNAVKAVVDWFQGVPGMFGDALNAVKNAFSTALDWIKSHWRLLISIVLGPLGIIIALVTKFWPQIIGAFQAGMNFLKGIWDAFWSVFGGAISAVFGLIVAIIKLALTLIAVIIYAAFLGIKAVTLAVWNSIVAIFQAVWGIITSVVRTYIAIVRTVITTAWNAIKAVTGAVWNGIMAVIRAVWARIGGTVMAAVNQVKSVLSAAWGAIKSAASAAWQALVAIVKQRVTNLINNVKTIKDKVVAFFADAGTWLIHAGEEIIHGLLQGIENVAHLVTDKIKSITGGLSKFLPGSPVKEGPLRVLNHGYAGKQIIGMIVDGMDTAAPTLARALDTYTSSVPSNFTTPTVSSGQSGGTTVNHAGTKTVEVTVVNPKPERASQSITKLGRQKVLENGWA